MSGGYVLYGGAGTGAVAVELALTLMDQPYELVELADAAALAAASGTNPMRQVPTLKFPDGELMTESAAILVRLAELNPAAHLAPGPDHPTRGAFLRWMSFVSSAIYAFYWQKDDLFRLVRDVAQHPRYEEAIERRITSCWATMDAQVTPGRYILGDTLSVLDLYVTVVSRFRPRRQNFYAYAPKMGEVVRRLDADPRLADLWARRYPFEDGWDR